MSKYNTISNKNFPGVLKYFNDNVNEFKVDSALQHGSGSWWYETVIIKVDAKDLADNFENDTDIVSINGYWSAEAVWTSTEGTNTDMIDCWRKVGAIEEYVPTRIWIYEDTEDKVNLEFSY